MKYKEKDWFPNFGNDIYPEVMATLITLLCAVIGFGFLYFCLTHHL